jgi:predicted MFS family arabinose efflux permease
MSESQHPASPAAGSWRDALSGPVGTYMLTINLGVLLVAMDTFVVSGIMPSIVADIGGVRLYSWTFALFAVGSVMGAGSAGPLRSIFGARTAYTGAGLVFLVSLIGAAFAPNMEFLVVMRLIQGIGGGAVASMAFGMIGVLIPPELRGRAVAIISMVWGLATVVGPAFGGVFAQYEIWRGAFWGLAALTLVFVIFAWRITPQTEGHGRLSMIPYRRLLMLGGAVLALSFTSQTDEFSHRLALFAAALVLSVWSFWRDAHASAPMFPRQAMNLLSEMGALHWIVALSAVTTVFVQSFVTLHLQVLRGLAPIYASYFLVVLSLSWSMSSIMVSHLKPHQEVRSLIAGLSIAFIGSIGAALTVADGALILFGLSMAAMGVGIGMTTPPIVQRAVRIAEPQEKVLAGSSIQAVRNVGISFGAAAAGWIAVTAGLTSNTMSHDVVARAMTWIYEGNVVVSLATLLVTIPLALVARTGATVIPPAA